MSQQVLYLSQGKLYQYNHETDSTSEIVCRFGQNLIDRATRRHQQNEWKAQDSNAPFQLWNWGGQAAPSQMFMQITGITAGTRPNELLYTMTTHNVGGMFLYGTDDDSEKRLVHKQEFFIRDLDRHSEENLVACAHRTADGTVNIGLVQGYHVRHLTEGDSIDESPSWIPGAGKQLLFQSAGIARAANGRPLGVGPFAIQKLDLDSGDLVTIQEDSKHDYLLPHQTVNGDLLYIRRPYESTGLRPASIGRVLGDIFLFPFRVLRTLFDYLNFMSMMYSQKPLSSAGGPQTENQDIQTIILRGRRINAQQAMRRGRRKDDAPALVPASWQLIRQPASGAKEEVLAKHVVAFDINDQGEIVYTNGNAVFKIDSGSSKSKRITRGRLIDNIYLI